jgi:hypothetical protein
MMGLVESPGNMTSTRGSGAMGMIELLRRRARGTERQGDTRPYQIALSISEIILKDVKEV